MLVLKNKKINTPDVFDQFFNRDLHRILGADFQANAPQVNIVENEMGYQIELAAPGLKKEDLGISIEQQTLTISAEKKSDIESKTTRYLKKEFSYQTFKRSFTVPEQVNVSGIKANYENGVLTVHLPKKEKKEAPASKTITIS